MPKDYEAVWVPKDTLPRELQFLQPLDASNPQSARVMVGPRQLAGAIEATDQTIAASTSQALSFSLNAILPGAFNAPPAGVGIVWELIRANITCRDVSAKLQICIPILISTSPGMNLHLGPYPIPLPMLFPPVIGAAYEIRATVPNVAYLPTDGSIANGPSCQIGLTNTDGAASHTYRRGLFCAYRFVYDVDYSKERVYVMGPRT